MLQRPKNVTALWAIYNPKTGLQRTTGKTLSKADSIYQVHVALREIDPPIWRLIEVSSQTTLKQFHWILQIAMGWENSHLHEYIVSELRYGTPDPLYDETSQVLLETGVRLERVLRKSGAKLLYLYDFGDFWEHDITLLASFNAEPGVTYPRPQGGGRSCPPEDCGGVRGYARLLETLLDPQHQDFEHKRTWVGLHFNAEVFSTVAVNHLLQKKRTTLAEARRVRLLRESSTS